ncbi:MAG: glycoside hydrolase family 2, partial [Myxococcota bacterium]|nr:glycoside hydrolase family 2 [Myxococcota bacterium]
MLRRKSWTSLNGPWDFAIDVDARCRRQSQIDWSRTILVPFAPETVRSGIGDTGLYRAVWYRRSIESKVPEGQRLILHFGAVDYHAMVWV